MTREAAQPAVRQRAVARLLASAMRSRAAYATLRATGLDDFVFDNDNHQRVWRQLEEHYATTPDAPSLDQIRMGLGEWADNLVEIECAEPMLPEELPGLVDEVLIDRQVRSHNSLRMQAKVALSKNDLTRAHALLEQCFEVEARIGAPARLQPRLPIYSPLSEMILTELQPVGSRLSTGFHSLDDATRGGIPMGKLIVIAGAPGAMKTGFATYLLERFESTGCACAYLAADEPASGVVTRLGQLGGFSRDALEGESADGTATRAMFATRSAGRMIAVLNPDTEGGPRTIEDADAVLRHFASGRHRVLVVDSLQTAQCVAANGFETARERIDAKVGLLKSIAKAGTLVIAISEMARSGYRSGDRNADTSTLAASKESGSIEYAATLLLGLRSVKGETGQIDVEVAKNRLGGGKPDFRLRFDFERANFGEITRPSEDEIDAAEHDRKERRKAERDAKQRERDRGTLLRAIGRNPGSTQARIIELAAIQAKRATGTLAELEMEGLIRVEAGPHNSRRYFHVGDGINAN